MTEIPDLIATRYGKRPNSSRANRLTIILLAVLFSICFIAWAIYANLTGSQVSAKTVSYEVLDDTHVSVTFEVTKDKNQSVSCVVKALKEDFGIVGYKEVLIPKGQSGVSMKVTLITTEPAVTGVADNCSVR